MLFLLTILSFFNKVSSKPYTLIAFSYVSGSTFISNSVFSFSFFLFDDKGFICIDAKTCQNKSKSQRKWVDGKIHSLLTALTYV